MKNFVQILLAAIVFVFVACEKNKEQDYLLHSAEWKSMIGTDYENEGNTKYSYNDNNKLNEIIFEYENTVQRRIINYKGDGRIENIIDKRNDIEENNTNYIWGQDSLEVITQIMNKDGEWVSQYGRVSKKLYQLDSDGKIIKEEFFSISFNDEWGKSNEFREYEWSNGNSVKEISKRSSSFKSIELNSLIIPQSASLKNHYKSMNDNLIYTCTYEYDDKENSSKFFGYIFNIEGLNNNNITKSVRYFDGHNVGDTAIYTYEYNDEGFPIKYVKEYYLNGVQTKDEVSLQYFYK